MTLRKENSCGSFVQEVTLVKSDRIVSAILRRLLSVHDVLRGDMTREPQFSAASA
jgi:hypothetical protein